MRFAYGSSQKAISLFIAFALLGSAIEPRSVAAQDDGARARIEAMAKRLAGAQRISVAIDSAYDVVQDSGEKIEFGERRELTLDRPNRVRVEVTGRDGSHRGLLFDGTLLTAFDLDEKVYATEEKPGTVAAEELFAALARPSA